MLTEAKQKKLERLIEIGAVVKDCPDCAVFFQDPSALAPMHYVNPYCPNAKMFKVAPRPHCTCDGCF